MSSCWAAGLRAGDGGARLVRVVRGPGYADRMMAAQLLGTGGIAALLLVGAADREGRSSMSR